MSSGRFFAKKLLDCIIELSEDLKLEFLSKLFWITNDCQSKFKYMKVFNTTEIHSKPIQ